MSNTSTSSRRGSMFSARSSLQSFSSDNVSGQSGRGGGGKSKFQRDIQAAINRGVSDCSNPIHWIVTTRPNPRGGRPWTDVAVKHPRDILTLMDPGPAKCACQKRACEWAWDQSNGWNLRGKYTTQWVLAGRYEKGIPSTEKGASITAARQVRPMYHSCDQSTVDKLNSRFPSRYFVPVGGQGHDHPIAHYSYKECAEGIFDEFARTPGTIDDPAYYIDVNGNPTANENFMRRHPGIVIITIVELVTPKDYMRRAQKWGPKFNAQGKQRYIDDIYIRDLGRDKLVFNGVVVEPHMVKGITAIHTAYYYAGDEISRLLACYDRAVFYALMHRFPTMKGTLNCGEQSWEKLPTTNGHDVVQTNVRTGEAYRHPDNSWWFDYDSRMYQDHAFGWTMGMVADENYVFRATTCPVSQARMSTRCLENKIANVGDDRPNGMAQTKDDMLSLRKVRCNFYGVQAEMNINPDHVDLFDALRQSMMGKARTHSDYRDHLARARTKNKSIMDRKGPGCNSQTLKDIALFSFCIDFEDDFTTDYKMFSTMMMTTLQADTLYRTGGTVSGTLLSSLMTIAMDCAESKGTVQVVSKLVRGGLRHGQAAGALRVLN
uniref:RNA-dependent RNA polymerase n=1 Tax=Grapevine-associated RNA virus 5 TaxID=2814391 RepID=A0A8F5MJH8_9VIRU|nr:MAG: RNA-dependent RNA polymerase [Grapevine-associated RNA virus 5]